MERASRQFSSLTMAVLAALMLMLTVLGGLHVNFPTYQASPGKHPWQQAAYSYSVHRLSGANDWQFNYEAAEKALLNVRQDSHGELKLDAGLVKILEEVTASLPPNMHNTDLQRLELLVARGLSGEPGKQLAKTVIMFYAFQQASIAAKHSDGQASTTDPVEALQQDMLRQAQYLGKPLADALFEKQNALRRYLLDRRRIHEDTRLSSSQKQYDLDALQARFKLYVD